MPLTQDEAAALLEASTTRVAYSRTTQTKLAVCTTAPTSTAAGTEPTGGSYARQNVTGWAAPVKADPTTTIKQSGAVSFNNMPACTVTHVDVYDSAGTPNRKWWGPLAAPRTCQAGDVLTFADAAIVLGLICAPGSTASV